MKWHTATAIACYGNIWYRCFYIYIFRCGAASLKAVSFIDLNPLGACAAVKQQSDKKNSLKVKTSRA